MSALVGVGMSSYGRLVGKVARQLHMLPEAVKTKVQELLQRTARILSA